jgi:hypothetical protein
MTSPISRTLVSAAILGAVLGAGIFTVAVVRPGGSSDAAGTQTAGSQAAEAAEAAPRVDARTQYDLARDIGETERLEPALRARRLDAIRRDWQGKRYRWRAWVIPALCRSADRCNVSPFDRAGADRELVHGWMPRLAMAPTAFAALQEQCADRPRCQIEFEGTLTRLVLSTEHFTSLSFTDVSVAAPR